jgi:hypothetical protein
MGGAITCALAVDPHANSAATAQFAAGLIRPRFMSRFAMA